MARNLFVSTGQRRAGRRPLGRNAAEVRKPFLTLSGNPREPGPSLLSLSDRSIVSRKTRIAFGILRGRATFDPLECTAAGAVLERAGPISVDSDPAFPIFNAWYASALVDALRGQDADPANDDISAQFNSQLGQGPCAAFADWYYGPEASPPMIPKISRQNACSATMRSKDVSSFSNHSGLVVGIA